MLIVIISIGHEMGMVWNLDWPFRFWIIIVKILSTVSSPSELVPFMFG